MIKYLKDCLFSVQNIVQSPSVNLSQNHSSSKLMLKHPNKCENKICCTSKFIEYLFKYLLKIENYENLSLWVRKVFNWSGLE